MVLYQSAFPGRKGFNLHRGFEEFRSDQREIVRQFEQDFEEELVERKDLQKLRDNVFRPALERPNEHVHLSQPISVHFQMAPEMISPPIFNVYDALAVVHTLLADRTGPLPDETTTWAPGTKQPEIITKYIDSLQRCCAIFANGANNDSRTKQKVEKMPRVVGFSVPVLRSPLPHDGYEPSSRVSIGSPNFGVSAAGNRSAKREIAKRRLEEFVKNPVHVQAINKIQGEEGEHWLSGNCAEQMFWPRIGEFPDTTYYVLAYGNRKEEGWRNKEACKNCQRLVNLVLKLQGFNIVDRYEPFTKEQREEDAERKRKHQEEEELWIKKLEEDPRARKIPGGDSRWDSGWECIKIGTGIQASVENLIPADLIAAFQAENF